MEACIVICRTNKRPGRRGQILMINAVNEVTRKNAQSWLDSAHIKKIADAYEQYSDVDGFAKIITINDAENNAWSLSIPLYVREVESEEAVDTRSVAECAASWFDAMFDMRIAYEDLKSLLDIREVIELYPYQPAELLRVAEPSEDTYKTSVNRDLSGGNADES